MSLIAWSCLTLSLTLLLSAVARGDERAPLIPRTLLFGNPDRANVQVSPDGTRLSWLAPSDGVMNVWVAPIDDLAQARVVTADRGRGIRRHSWAHDNVHVLYPQDVGGNENWNLHAVHVSTGVVRNLTPNPAVSAHVQQTSVAHPGEVLAAINDRNPMFHDVHRIDLAAGTSSLLWQNPGTIDGSPVVGSVADESLRVRLALTATQDGGQAIHQPTHDGWTLLARIPFEDAMATDVIGFDAAGEVLFLKDSRGRDTAAVVAHRLADGTTTLLAADDRANAGDVLLHPTTRVPQAVAFDYDRRRWQVIDPSLEADFALLASLEPGELSIPSRSLDDRTWIVQFVHDTGPVRWYRYDRGSRQATFLFSNRVALESVPLQPMHAPVIRSRDGLNLVSYLTLPPGSDGDGDGVPATPLPMVLVVHGGPWARDGWGLNPLHQWLADRGYAVLSVNYRGSTGFGKAFVNAANREWAGKMHDDLLDAVAWAVDRRIAVPDRVAIMGGSYGGYATLVGMTFTPEAFAAGVAIVGPSRLVTLMNTFPPYWAPAMALWKTRVGDHTTEEGRAFLDSRSPLMFVDRIRRPLLIGQGANDPRVKQSESDQIVAAMQQKRIPVTYVLYPDEGHGFARPENRLSFFAITEHFLAEHLGGRAEPIGADLANSSIQVPAGAEEIDTLPESLGVVR
jgi:dipeptidyl aminopeptidase/acylaminoacyl peptidase